MASGSQVLGERLPAVFGTGTTYYHDRRPAAVRPIGEPEDEGLHVDVMELSAGEATMHHTLDVACLWPERDGPPASSRRRPLRRRGDHVVRSGSLQVNYTDEEVGLTVGDRIGGPYFPLVPTETP